MTPTTSTTSNPASTSTPTGQTVEAILLPDGLTLRLKQKLDLPAGEVIATVGLPNAPSTNECAVEILRRLHRERDASGRPRMTEEQMQAELAEIDREEREYEAEIEQLWTSIPTNSSEPQ